MEKINSELNNFSTQKDEIDLSIIFKILVSRKKLIFLTTASFFIIGCIYGLLQKKIWEGEFQIVLSSNNSSVSPLPSVRNIRLFSQISNPIQTEIEILQSPSVLFPIYNSYLSRRKINSIDYPFKKWKNEHLSVKTLDGTSILEIKYQDNEKLFINETLKEITKIYKDYSPKKKVEIINTKIGYVEDQINIFKVKYEESFDKAIRFSLKNGLTSSFSNDVTTNNIGGNEGILISQLDMWIDELPKLNKAIDLISFSNSNKLKNQAIQSLVSNLNQLRSEIQIKENYFVKDDLSLTNLRERENILALSLKKELVSLLNSEKNSAEIRMQMAKNSSDILLEDRKNLREAKENENIYRNFQKQLRNLKFDLKEKSIPWELITEPIVNKNPIKPNKRKIAGLWAIFGFFASCSFVFYQHNKKGLIISENEIKNLLGIPMIDKIKIGSYPEKIKTLEIISKGNLANSSNIEISIVLIGDIDKELLNKFNEITNLDENKRFKIKEGLHKIEPNDLVIFLIQMETVYKKDLEDLNNMIEINGIPVFGFISLSY